MNISILVGEIVAELKSTRKNERDYYSTLVKVRRDFKNQLGEETYDIIPILFWEGVSTKFATEQLVKGVLVSVRARLSNFVTKNADGAFNSNVSIIAEKITILPQNNSHDEAPIE